MRRFRPVLLLLVFASGIFLSLAGCLRGSYVEKHTFVLDVSRGGPASVARPGTVLRIRRFRVSSRYENKSFVYRTGDLSYEPDYYNQFLTSPSALITEEVREWLAASGLFEQVVDFSGEVTPTYILEGIVKDLYGDYSERGNRPRAKVVIDFILVEEVSGVSKIVFQKSYGREVPVKGIAPAALVQGWNKALEKILAEFEKDLREKAGVGD